jgi:hypothetical protein
MPGSMLAIAFPICCSFLAAFYGGYAASDRAPFDDLVKQFSPQPYIQLGKIFRAAGYETSSKAVLTRLERNRTRYSDIGFFFRLWRWLLDVLLRYGYSPFRPVLILIAWALFSAVVFQAAYDQNQIIAARDNQAIQTASDPRPRTAFNAVVYAVDTLVPIVDLNQKRVGPLSASSSGNSLCRR